MYAIIIYSLLIFGACNPSNSNIITKQNDIRFNDNVSMQDSVVASDQNNNDGYIGFGDEFMELFFVVAVFAGIILLVASYD